MKKNKVLEVIKNISIIFLIILAIYQFFDLYTTDAIGEITSSWFNLNQEATYFMPSETLISFGTKEFVKIKSQSAQEDLIRDYIREIYDIIFRTKISYDEIDTNVLDIINDRSIILCYDEYNTQMASELFDITNDKILKTINKIENIIIVPSTSENSKCETYIYGNDKLIRFEISIDTTELYGLIDEINMFRVNNIYLLSENYSYKKNFKSLVFIPAVIIENELFENDKDIKIENAFNKNGVFNEEELENYINTFFDNPTAKWKMEKDEQTLIYGDGERTITAYKDGFVTYSYSLAQDNNININDAIDEASEKLNKDIYLSKYIKLSDAKKVDEATYELYYDYYINNSKVELSNAIRKKYKIYYPLQVTIRGNDISNIKAVILKFTEPEPKEDDDLMDDRTLKYDINNYENVINDFITKYPNLMIDDFKLGYFKANMIDDARLKWIITSKDDIFTYDIYK